MIQKPRGTIDILPDSSPVWRYIESKARETAACFGYGEIRFPTFEATELFNRGVGDTSDVVQKEMYTFLDRENRSFTLRPEGTACVARSFIENNLYTETMPQKLYYLVNCFRYEKPQAGRSREFYQFGAELFGSGSAMADAEIISLARMIILNIGITDFSLEINSIGCPACRPAYHRVLKEYFLSQKENLCETCRGRLETNPLRILDCKSPVCSKIAENAPRSIENLCGDCSSHFAKLQDYLNAMKIPFLINTKIVRGLDYYTKTVFEFISENIGAQSTLCGGGRYDGLIETVGGPKIPGIGFAMGITRLILAYEEEQKIKEKQNEIKTDCPELYIAPMGNDAQVIALDIIQNLRYKNISADCDIMGRSLKAQMKYADKIKASYVLILGDNEIVTGAAEIKNMKTGEQTKVYINDIENLIKILKNIESD